MPGPWDDSAEKRLLLCIIDTGVKPNWAEVASTMNMGFTGEACRQKFYKLKREAESMLNQAQGTPTVTTPASKGKTTAAKSTGKKSTPSKRKTTTDKDNVEDGEDDESPSKKSKQAIASLKEEVEDDNVTVKAENDGGDTTTT